MRKFLLCLIAGLCLLTSNASAQTSLCQDLNQIRVATWPNRLPNDNSYRFACPSNAIAVGDYCYEYVRVGFCNSKGLGSCHKGNKYTQECLDAEVCLSRTKNAGGICNQLALKADVTYQTAIDCNNMTGTWNDNYGVQKNLTQLDGSQLYSGVENTNTADTPEDQCGIWDVSGVVTSDGEMTMSSYSRKLPKKGDHCGKWYTFTGTAACGIAYGNWFSDLGGTGTMDMVKVGSGIHSQSPPVSTNNVRPRYDDTIVVQPPPGPPPPPPPPSVAVALTVTAGNKSATLTWTSILSPTNFGVMRAVAAPPGSYIQIGTTTGKSYVDVGLANGAQYNYIIQALGPRGTILSESKPVYTMPPCWPKSVKPSFADPKGYVCY